MLQEQLGAEKARNQELKLRARELLADVRPLSVGCVACLAGHSVRACARVCAMLQVNPAQAHVHVCVRVCVMLDTFACQLPEWPTA